MHLKKTLAALSATAAFAATTPYDLIRPTWPLSWNEKVFDLFDTTGTKQIGVLDIAKTPASFKAGALIARVVQGNKILATQSIMAK